MPLIVSRLLYGERAAREDEGCVQVVSDESLAEEKTRIRDPESHFMLGSDNHGMLHVLYAYISRRRFFIVGARGGEAGAWATSGEQRHRQIAMDQL